MAELVVEEGVEKTGKVSVESFVSGDELIGEGKTGHEAALFQPVDGAEGAGEEDTFNAGKGDEALGKTLGRVDPFDGPVGLLGHDRDGFHRMEETVLLNWVLDVALQEEGVHFRVDVFNGNLEAVESTGFWDLDFLHEAYAQVFEDNSVGGGKEGEDMRDEVLFTVVEGFPVNHVTAKVDFLSCR